MRASDRADMYPRRNTLIACHGFGAAACLAAWARRMCPKYLKRTLEPKRLLNSNAVHSFRHSCAMHLLASGWSITDIKNFLGHENLQSTMIYLKLSLTARKEAQKKFVQYTDCCYFSKSYSNSQHYGRPRDCPLTGSINGLLGRTP